MSPAAEGVDSATHDDGKDREDKERFRFSLIGHAPTARRNEMEVAASHGLSTMTPGKIAVLRGLELFRDVPDERLCAIASCLRLRTLARSEILVAEGDGADAFFVVVSGRFEVVERNQAVAEIGVGQPVGEIAFFAGGRRRASVIALRPGSVVEIDRPAFERVRLLAPGIERNLIEQLARRLDALEAIASGHPMSAIDDLMPWTFQRAP